jgi:hypothetical protein
MSALRTIASSSYSVHESSPAGVSTLEKKLLEIDKAGEDVISVAATTGPSGIINGFVIVTKKRAENKTLGHFIDDGAQGG